MTKYRTAQSGFTLAEVLIASAILSFAVIAITQMVVAGQMSTYEALHHRRGQSLAEAMMEEILSLPYADPDGESLPGPEAGESDRSDFDNMDDFHNFAEAAGAAADSAGEVYPQLFSRFSRQVTVMEKDITVPGFDDPIPGLEIVVTVNDTVGQAWRIVRFVPEPAP